MVTTSSTTRGRIRNDLEEEITRRHFKHIFYFGLNIRKISTCPQINSIANCQFPPEKINNNIESALLLHSEHLQKTVFTGNPLLELTLHIVNLWKDVRIYTVWFSILWSDRYVNVTGEKLGANGIFWNAQEGSLMTFSCIINSISSKNILF